MDYLKKICVPMSAPDISELERELVNNVMQTSYLSMGPYIQEFENAFCSLTGAKYAYAVNSGTSGLHLCVRAAQWQDGDWVITTPFSFVSSANALLYERVTPIFVDVDPQTGNINAQAVADAIRHCMQGKKIDTMPRHGYRPDGKLKGVIAVDVFGQPADYDTLNTVAQEYGLTVIEDSCEALGAKYKGHSAGCLADMGVFAFYPNKQITTGEGGVVVTQNGHFAEMISALRNQGRATGDTWLEHTHLGYNYRLDELSAALGAAQMRRFDELIAKRSQTAAWYFEELQDLDALECPLSAATTTRDSWFVYVVRLKTGLDRTKVIAHLEALGIPARPYFSPIHLQPYMCKLFGYQSGDFPITEDIGARGMALPFSGVMTQEQVQEVCACVRQILC